ncbi:MAG: hypothetical protein VKN33_11095 [Candidatus Sericytochromatia bacterium]|nr:hypothetical protein [Candidatus Sericytochromatia bacterium]
MATTRKFTPLDTVGQPTPARGVMIDPTHHQHGGARPAPGQPTLSGLLDHACACAVYQIDREELGFGAKGAGEAGGLADGNNSGTMPHSVSKGLWPLMTLIETGINEAILRRLPNAEAFINE